MTEINVLAVIRPDALEHYRANLEQQMQLAVETATSSAAALALLEQPTQNIDVVVLDNTLDDAFDLVGQLRDNWPRLVIVLVDEEADFLMPGRADDVSTEPFKENDLRKRILKLLEERQTETLRADSLPPVRSVAKQLRQATGLKGKVAAATEAIAALGYALVAFYQASEDSADLPLTSASGEKAITTIAPLKQGAGTITHETATGGGLHIFGPDDDPNYVLVKRGRLGAGACVAVGRAPRYGVLIACRDQPGSISSEDVMMLELIGTQLAASLARDPKVEA